MRTVTAREGNQRFSELLSAVEHGETVVVTKRGRPVAEIRPVATPETERARREAAQARMAAVLAEARQLADPDFRYTPLTEDEIYEGRLRWPR